MTNPWLYRLIVAVCGGWLLAAQAHAQKTELVVYTSYENDDLVPYKAAFEKDNPDVSVRWVRDATGIITARLVAEKDNPRADAIWGLAATSLGVLEDYDILEPYTPKGIETFNPKFRDPKTPTRWWGNSVWIAAIVFNTAEAQKRGIPKPATWMDLTNPVYKGHIVMPHAVSSGTGFLDVSAWLQAFGEDKGWAFMDALHKNMARYTHSGTSPATLAASGEHIVGIAFDLRGAREKSRGAPIDIIFPKEALGWDMNAFAIVKGTKKLDAAKRLADWAASPTAMALYGSTRSVAAVPGYAKPIEHLPTDLESRLMDNDFAWASRNRERILQEWARRYDEKADPKKN